MDSRKILGIAIVVLAAFTAIYLGFSVATAQAEAVGWLLGGIGLAVCLLLGRRIYLLIPITASISLLLPLPGRLTLGTIAEVVVLGFITLLFLSRRLSMRTGFSELEGWGLLLFLSVVQVYLRHPVGLDVLGSGSVGAKPYAIFALNMCCALVLSVQLINPRDLILWVRLSFISSILDFGVGAVGRIFPQVDYYLGTTDPTTLDRSNDPEEKATRIAFVRGVSTALAVWISSRISPLRACFHPLWAPLILLSLALAGFSGYRTQSIQVGLVLLLGIYYRGGIINVVASVGFGIMGLFMLGFINLVTPLPVNIQRALSFLPGTWDNAIKRDTSDSTEWRVEMWKEALLTDRWIENKWLGDGLGFSSTELARMKKFEERQEGQTRVGTALTIQQESMMISGSYHSGPVQTVRTTGYVGLAVLLMAMVRVAVHGHRQIERCRNTEWFPVALFIGIPIISLPIIWAFVFGTFDGGAAGVMMGAAIIRMLENNLPLPAYARGRKLPA